jgi:cyclopropane fatty-acyl-phospholipid synthase-like methyltransferase
MTNKEKLQYLEAVRAYWRENHQAWLENVGDTFQGGLFFETEEADIDAGFSNRRLAHAAQIRPGSRVLDAGCGVCGPAIDIARAIDGVTIEAVTISPEQAQTARERVARAGLGQSIRVLLADYHRLPFADAVFDHVCFFESSCYSYSLEELFAEAFRALRPGGNIYIKDVFRREGELNPQERADLELFDATYCNRSSTLGEAGAALENAGFADVRTAHLTGQVSTVHGQLALFRFTNGDVELSAFGERHFRRYKDLPTLFGEITAVKRSGIPPETEPY